jgi:head-tail adaptor
LFSSGSNIARIVSQARATFVNSQSYRYSGRELLKETRQIRAAIQTTRSARRYAAGAKQAEFRIELTRRNGASDIANP